MWLHSTSELSSEEATVGAKNSVSAELRALLSRKSTNTRRSTFPAAYSCLDAYWVYNALMSCNVPTHCLLSWIKLLILWNHCPLWDSFRQFQRNVNLIRSWWLGSCYAQIILWFSKIISSPSYYLTGMFEIFDKVLPKTQPLELLNTGFKESNRKIYVIRF